MGTPKRQIKKKKKENGYRNNTNMQKLQQTMDIQR